MTALLTCLLQCESLPTDINAVLTPDTDHDFSTFVDQIELDIADLTFVMKCKKCTTLQASTLIFCSSILQVRGCPQKLYFKVVGSYICTIMHLNNDT